MTHGDNPAARLGWFMEQLRPHIGTNNSTSHAGLTCCEVFGLKWPDDAGLLLELLADVAALARQTRAMTDELSPEWQSRRLLGGFDQVEQVVANFGSVGQMTTFQLMYPMTDAGWQSLATADIVLHGFAAEPVLDENDVQRLLDQTRELADAIRTADDITPGDRRWLLAVLAEVERALTNIDLVGFADVEAATDRFAAGIFRAGRDERLKRSSLAQRIGGLIVGLDLMLNVAANTLAIQQAIKPPSSQPLPSPVVVQIQERFELPALPSGAGRGSSDEHR